MPNQALIGLILSVLSIVGVYCAYAFKLGEGALVAAVGLGKLGDMLIGKERFAQSAEAVQKYSKRPPSPPSSPALIVFIAFGVLLGSVLLGGCGAAPLRPDYPESQARAEALDEKLDDAQAKIAEASGLIESVCSWRGEDSTDCVTLRSLRAVTTEAIATARATLALYQSSGVAIAAADAAIDRVASEASGLAAQAARLAEVVYAEIRGLRDRPSAMDPERPEAPAAPALAPSPVSGS